MTETAEPTLVLALKCGCVATLARRKSDERFVLHRFESAKGCAVHQTPPPTGAPVHGFGPYPDWSVNTMLRVNSLPEAGGMMEREHAFILDGQFLFLETSGAPRPVGPIRDASWMVAVG